MPPFVSIILPCYNKEAFVEETIHSILQQTYPHFEIIVIDDCSSDKSKEILSHLAEQHASIKTKFLTENKGANHCRNLGIQLAKGDYILMMDADDLLKHDCLKKRVTYMKGKTLDFAVFTMQVFHKKPGDDSRCWKPQTNNALIDFLKHDLPWQTMQPLWNSEFIKNTKGFDESFEKMQDVEFHTSVLLLQARYELIVSEADCYYRIAEERKNYNPTVFLTKWVNSAVKYYIKFYEPAKNKQLNKFLNGTIFQTYLHVLHEYRLNRISDNDFQLLERKLLTCLREKQSATLKLIFFKIAKGYNLHLPRIPGINKGLKQLIIN